MWLYLVIPLLITQALANHCPDEEDIYPCYCYESYDDHPVADCNHIKDIKVLEGVLNSTRGLNVSFEFWNMELDELPSNLFEDQLSTNVEFHHCSIISFGDRPFTGLEDTLTSLSITGSVNQDEHVLERFPLGHLKNLKYLVYEGNNIRKLGNDWFQDGPETLREVNLDVNDIEELGDSVFASLVNLKQLWLGENKIVNISRSMFPMPANKLRLIDFTGNKIEELPEDIFQNMTALRVVVLPDNFLTTISEDTWGEVWDQLKEVYLNLNRKISCDERIKWIYQRKKLPKIFTGRCGDGKYGGAQLKNLRLEDFD